MGTCYTIEASPNVVCRAVAYRKRMHALNQIGGPGGAPSCHLHGLAALFANVSCSIRVRGVVVCASFRRFAQVVLTFLMSWAHQQAKSA